MWILYTAGYVFVGYIAYVIFRNSYITSNYLKELDGSTSLYSMERALRRAKLNFDLDLPFLILAATFWVVCLPSFVLYRGAQALPKIPVFRSKAERQVDMQIAKKALSDARKKEWDNALQTMEDAGINTRELRKMQID